jgi:hypothetical protein
MAADLVNPKRRMAGKGSRPRKIHKITRARIFKLLRSPRINIKDSVPPGGPVRQPYAYSVPSPH